MEFYLVESVLDTGATKYLIMYVDWQDHVKLHNKFDDKEQALAALRQLNTNAYKWRVNYDRKPEES